MLIQFTSITVLMFFQISSIMNQIQFQSCMLMLIQLESISLV